MVTISRMNFTTHRKVKTMINQNRLQRAISARHPFQPTLQHFHYLLWCRQPELNSPAGCFSLPWVVRPFPPERDVLGSAARATKPQPHRAAERCLAGHQHSPCPLQAGPSRPKTAAVRWLRREQKTQAENVHLLPAEHSRQLPPAQALCREGAFRKVPLPARVAPTLFSLSGV